MTSPRKRPLRLAYILSTYPGLTTTFVDREVRAVQALGADLRIIAINLPITMLSEEQKEIQKIVSYLEPLGRGEIGAAHLAFAITRPRRYFSTLAYLITRQHGSLFARRKALRQFTLGLVVANRLRRAPPDHLHVHIVKWALVGLVASRMLGVPYSVTAHASGDIFVEPTLLEEKLSSAKFIATCTRYNEDYLKQYGKGVFDEKVKCIYHGLDAKQYRRAGPRPPAQETPPGEASTPSQAAAGADSASPSAAGCPVILGVGQLKERKGFQVLLEACEILHAQGLEFECRIVGEGPLRAAFEERIRRAGLEGVVNLPGALPHEQVFAEYERAHIFALPAVLAGDGDRDGIPNVILEALAMELPVVSTRHSAIPEVIEDGVNGLLVEPGDSAALAAALRRLITTPALREALALRGRQTVLDRFDPITNARLLLDEVER